MRWGKVRAVARFELRSTVRRFGYLLITFGMPLFALAYGGIAALPGYFLAKQITAEQRVGLVDEAGVLGLESGEEIAIKKVVFVTHADEASARRALSAERDLRCYYVLPPDYIATGAVSAYGSTRSAYGPWGGREELSQLVRERLLGDALSAAVRARILKPVEKPQNLRVDGQGTAVSEPREAVIGRLVLPVGFMLLLVMSIVMTGTYLIQATATEKENKVIEVLLASANADEIMAGKLLGLGGAGLIQVAVWLSLTLGARLSLSAALDGFDMTVPWQALALSPVLFVIAYAFLGSLMLGTGSLGGNVRESQQLGMIWALFATLPVVFLPLILEDPRGIAAIALSWLPFTSPAALICRLSLDPDSVPAWELSGILALMLFSTWWAVRIASRLFRVGLLLSGPRPSFRQIVAQARMLR